MEHLSLSARLMWGIFLIIGAMVMSEQPAASDPPKLRYVFVENTDHWVEIIRSEWQLTGKLDKNGDFVFESKLKKGHPAISAPSTSGVINNPASALKAKKVFEFRSGLLIPGEVQPGGRFVPEAGGKIILFKDYEYTPTATPIWNLPGVFITEEEAAKLKKPKPADGK